MASHVLWTRLLDGDFWIEPPVWVFDFWMVANEGDSAITSCRLCILAKIWDDSKHVIDRVKCYTQWSSHSAGNYSRLYNCIKHHYHLNNKCFFSDFMKGMQFFREMCKQLPCRHPLIPNHEYFIGKVCKRVHSCFPETSERFRAIYVSLKKCASCSTAASQ